MNRKKAFFLSFWLLLLLFITTACGQSHFFGNVDFGMTRDEVKNAESALGEPVTVLNDESFLYREIPYLNIGGDVIYRFDENNKLNGIIFYAYQQYYNDEAYASFLDELKAAHKGYAETPQTDADAVTENWTIEGTSIKVTMEYKADTYMIVRYQLVE